LIPDYIPESEQIKPSGDSNFIRILGWTATISSISMYFAYIDQISRNLDGQKAPSSRWQPHLHHLVGLLRLLSRAA
jgi:hypothetical protein